MTNLITKLRHLSPAHRIGIILALSIAFFCAEIGIGFKTRSLALIADAFHYLNDIVAYAIALAAAILKTTKQRPRHFTFAFHRAELLGAFFNGVFLIALALSILFQSIERFIKVEPIDQPLLVIIIGGIGLVLNLLSAVVAHGHVHKHEHHHDAVANPETPAQVEEREGSTNTAQTDSSEDVHALHNHVRLPPPVASHRNLGMMGVLVHLMGDAANNVGVIVAGVIIYELHSPNRYYVDPAISLFISLMIFASAIPLTKQSGRILLEAAPSHLDLGKIVEDLVSVPDVESIHDFHIWHLTESDYLASFHVTVAPETNILKWGAIEENLRKCMSGYGITHVTMGPESSVVEPERRDCGNCHDHQD